MVETHLPITPYGPVRGTGRTAVNAARDFLRRWDFMSVDDETVSVEVRDKMKPVRERLDNDAAVKDSRRTR